MPSPLWTRFPDKKVDDKMKKPEIITEYNRTNNGVDTVDQLCHRYTVTRPTRRWPMCVFYGMLDITAVYSIIVFLYSNPHFHPKDNSTVSVGCFWTIWPLVCSSHIWRTAETIRTDWLCIRVRQWGPECRWLSCCSCVQAVPAYVNTRCRAQKKAMPLLSHQQRREGVHKRPE